MVACWVVAEAAVIIICGVNNWWPEGGLMDMKRVDYCIASDMPCTIGTEGQTSQCIFYSNNSSTMSVFKGTPEYDVSPTLCDHTINGIVTIKDRIITSNKIKD